MRGVTYLRFAALMRTVRIRCDASKERGRKDDIHMKQYRKQLLCGALTILMACGIGCVTESVEPPIGQNDPEIQSEVEVIGVVSDPNVPTATLNPTQTQTPELDATPFPTRAPIAGDVSTDRYPNYDTGRNADYSYQSDELRVAVTRHEDEEDQIVYYVADLWIRNINSFHMGSGNGKFGTGREKPESFAQRENAILAINGTMNSGLVVHNGYKLQNVENSSIGFRSGIAVVYRDGSVKMFNLARKQTFNYDKENKNNGGIWQAFQFGPILVQDGQIPTGLKQRERHPRAIFGYCGEPGHYIAVVVDGRTTKSIGMTEQEMAELMLSLGCTDAINLDGGNSAVMLFMGKTISTPSGKDNDGDGVADRNVNDMLEFAAYDENGVAPDLSTLHADKFLGE